MPRKNALKKQRRREHRKIAQQRNREQGTTGGPKSRKRRPVKEFAPSFHKTDPPKHGAGLKLVQQAESKIDRLAKELPVKDTVALTEVPVTAEDFGPVGSPTEWEALAEPTATGAKVVELVNSQPQLKSSEFGGESYTVPNEEALTKVVEDHGAGFDAAIPESELTQEPIEIPAEELGRPTGPTAEQWADVLAKAKSRKQSIKKIAPQFHLELIDEANFKNPEAWVQA